MLVANRIVLTFLYIWGIFKHLEKCLPQVQAVPSDIGLISYFENNCPLGWQMNKETSCRVLLAPGTTTDSLGEKRTAILEEFGGEFRHQLTEAQIPPPSHLFQSDGRHGSHPQTPSTLHCDWGNVHHPERTLRSASTGDNQAHNNMPPYMVMKSCRKMKDNHINISNFATKTDLISYTPSAEFLQASQTLADMKISYLLKSKVPNLTAYVKIDSMPVRKDLLIKEEAVNYLLDNKFHDFSQTLDEIFSDYVKKSELNLLFSDYLTYSELPPIENFLRRESLKDYTLNEEFIQIKNDLNLINSTFKRRNEVPMM